MAEWPKPGAAADTKRNGHNMSIQSLLDKALAPLFVGVPTPAFSHVTPPMLRQAMTGSAIERAGLELRDQYGDRADGAAMRLVVIRSEGATGLPVVRLALDALDSVIDENLAFAQCLIREGVATMLHVFAGAPHGFGRLDTAPVTKQVHQLHNGHLKRGIAQ
jgi:acetyl esterase/lipase